MNRCCATHLRGTVDECSRQANRLLITVMHERLHATLTASVLRCTPRGWQLASAV
jgi:hypothetical protein